MGMVVDDLRATYGVKDRKSSIVLESPRVTYDFTGDKSLGEMNLTESINCIDEIAVFIRDLYKNKNIVHCDNGSSRNFNNVIKCSHFIQDVNSGMCSCMVGKFSDKLPGKKLFSDCLKCEKFSPKPIIMK